MEDLKTLEGQMHKDISDYVKAMDEFETALSNRTSEWHNREIRSKKNATMRGNTMSIILTLAIALGAAIASIAVLFGGQIPF